MVEWRHEQTVSKESTRRLRNQVPFRLVSKVSVWGTEWSAEETVARNDQRSVRNDGNRNSERARDRRSRARVLIGAAEIFAVRSNETNQREHSRANIQRVSGDAQEVLGPTVLGTRILREHGRDRRRSDQKIYQRAEKDGQSTQTLGLTRSHRRSRWFFTSYPKIPGEIIFS